MAINKKLDDPQRNSAGGFLNDVFEETRKNTRGRFDTSNIKNPGTRNFHELTLTLLFSSVVALPVSLALLQNDLQPHDEFRDRIDESASVAIEDPSIEDGILVSNEYIAIRNGDEFTLYNVVGSSDQRAILSRVNSENEALRISANMVQSYETYIASDIFERENNVDINTNDNIREIDVNLLTQPYNVNDSVHTYIDAIGFDSDEFQMDAETLNEHLNDWQTVYSSISDGGYGQFDESATLEATLEDVSNSDAMNNLLTGYAVFYGLAFAGGVGMVANRRRKEHKDRYNLKEKDAPQRPPKIG
jgi:hypothetical protein